MRKGSIQNWRKLLLRYWPILVAVAITLTAFYPIIFQNRTLASSSITAGVMGTAPPWDSNPDEVNSLAAVHYPDPGASAWQDEALVEKTAYEYRRLDIPLWNSSAGLGKPLAAEMVSAVFFPLKFILFAFPNPIGWDVFLIARILGAGILAYLFLRLIGLHKLSSVIGGTLFALNGYFMLFIPMVHVSVEMLLPLLFIGFELIARKSQYGWVVLSAAIFGLVTGGHPESSVLIFTAGAIFFLFRFIRNSEKKWMIKQTILGLAIGGALSMLLLLPFLEFLQYAFTSHTPDQLLAGATDPPMFFFTMLYPYLLGSPLAAWTNIWGGGTGVRLWLGVFPVFFALVSVFSLKKYWQYTLPFLILAVFSLTKQFGFIDYSWLNHVPLFNLISFQRYITPELGFTMAVLAALGFQFVFTSKKIRIMYLGIPLAVIVGTLIFLRKYWQLADESGNAIHFFDQFRWLALLLMLAVTVMLAAQFNKNALKTLCIVMAIAMIGEIIFLVPKHWPKRTDPFVAPPFVEYLQEHQGDNRIFAKDYLLYPNSSSAFNLLDIRDLDAVFVSHYIRYVQEFLNPTAIDKFTGIQNSATSETKPTKIKNNTFFDLLAVKYVIAKKPITDKAKFITQVIKHNSLQNDEIPPRVEVFTIDGESRAVLFQHTLPDGKNTIEKKITPMSLESQLTFAPALDPEVWEKEGDGVQFTIVINGTEEVYDEWIDPRINEEDRHWNDISINLGEYQGEEITVTFVTSMGKSNMYDSSGWGGLKFSDIQENDQQYLTAYNDNGIVVSENIHAYPRAFLVGDVIEAQTDDAIIDAMKKKEFDPRITAVVKTSGDIPLERKEKIPFTNTEIVEQDDNSVTIKTHAPHEAMLVLSDTFYPGWKATIDGQKAAMYQADLAFRGVVLSEGDHIVEFTYNPLSFRIGFTISVVTLLGVILYFLVFQQQKNGYAKKEGGAVS